MPGFELFSEEERKEVNDVLETGILMRYNFDALRNEHWKALEFENLLTQKLQVAHCSLVSSGTAALTVALKAAGIGYGDEVIMPVFTFVASFEAVLMTGATPVLVDVDDTLNLCPEKTRLAITRRTRCIMPVHMCGSPARLAALKTICQQHNLVLLEDACQALGGMYDGKFLGTYGDLGCFSFDFVKTITCGEGGAVVTDNLEIATLVENYHDHGHDHIGKDRGAEGHPIIGFNFRISELHAAVGIAQLRKLDTILNIQQKHYEIIRRELARIPQITFRTVPEGGVENYSFLNFLLPEIEIAEEVHRRLIALGIDGCFYWYKNNWHYINGWQHLKSGSIQGALPEAVSNRLQALKTTDFSQSDYYIGRNISLLIKLGWTENEMLQRAQTIAKVVSDVCG